MTDAKKEAAHKEASKAVEAGLPPMKNPYEFGAIQWVAWASHYGTLAHGEPERLQKPRKWRKSNA